MWLCGRDVLEKGKGVIVVDAIDRVLYEGEIDKTLIF